MKKITMHVVKTVDRAGYETTSFVEIGTDYHKGWGIPVSACKIISEKTEPVSVFEVGDRVIVDLWRGGAMDEDGVSSGGHAVTKCGIVTDVYGGTDGTHGFVRFDDGDKQSVRLIEGSDGHPGKNIRPEKTIAVACRKRDAKCFAVQKYDNNEPWNVTGGTAPSGVHATRYLRKTNPNTGRLSPLARWLFENVPGCVAGTMPHPRSECRVRCYNGKTEAERIMDDAARCCVNNISFSQPNRAGESPEIQAARYAKNLIKCYGLENEPQKIDDWLFDIIEPDQSDEDYWNAVANKMTGVGITAIETNNQRWGHK